MKHLAVIAVAFLTLLSCASGPSNDPVVVRTGHNERTFTGLTEMGTGFLGGTKSRGDGRIEIGSSGLIWHNEKGSDRNISLRPEVISRVWLTCASRAGENLCLDLGVKTLTGNEHHFRDTNWEGGVNTVVLDAYEYMKTVYPQVRFDRRDVERFR